MLILFIRTDKPEAHIGLYNDNSLLVEEKWEGYRELSTTIHKKIEELLKKSKHDWNDIKGIVCFKGPGSFTGLRIGMTVGNSLAENLAAPIVATSGEVWLEEGVALILAGKNERNVLPEYGGDAHITPQKR